VGAKGGTGRVSLLLGLGDIADLLPAIVASVDAFYLDGFAPAKNPQMWDEGLLSRLNRLAAPDCTAATWSAARGVRDALAHAGFEVERAPGFAGKRDMTRAVYAPRYAAPPLPGGCWPQPSPADRHAIVLGAGIAGCAAALALCRQGWRVTLVDQHEDPASEASGNAGGMFHSVLHNDDGIHARAHRAGSLATWARAHAWIEAGLLPGQSSGLLRLDAKTHADAAQALLARQGLPPEHVQWLDPAQARARSGLPVASGGWLFHQAGWLHPGKMARLMLDEAASLGSHDGASGETLLACLWSRPVHRLRQDSNGAWQLLDEGGACIAQAPTLVLCTATQTARLLDTLPPEQAVAPLPLSAVRGQITEVRPSMHPLSQAGHASLSDIQKAAAPTLPVLPVAGSGYVLALPSGGLLCGATTQHHDTSPEVREADHRHNLEQAARLGALPEAWLADWPGKWPGNLQLSGRTAWRTITPDRLPLGGALPLSAERLAQHGGLRRHDQVRLLPRQRGERGGLYAMTGLGSRGITWCWLAADLLAHWVTGSPCPVEVDLRDALDPARFVVRQMTRGA
jgi:tRNA 5-methylaminomethyl-2-thiouridine biosynthesis bifunctional protein